jgi:hypothetical protein
VPLLATGASGRRRALAAASCLLLAAYAAVLIHLAADTAGGSDSSGYLNLARMLGEGRVVTPIAAAATFNYRGRTDHLLPLGFVRGPTPDSKSPYYPPGFPLHLLGFALVLGWDRGPFVVAPIAATVALWLFYRLARELSLSRHEALAGTAILALHPALLYLGLQPMGDAVATAWTSAAVLTALRARRAPAWAAVSGAAFAIAVLVRPSNALLLLTLALALPLTSAAVLRFVLGGLPFAAVFLGFNAAAYGHPLLTGYGMLERDLALAYFPKRWDHYTHWLGRTLTPLVPLAWLGVAAARDVPRRDRALLLVWFSSYFFFYCFYRHYDVWWYLRFLLPGFPALIAGALLAARPLWRELELAVRLPRGGFTSGNALPLVVLGFILAREAKHVARERVFDIARAESVYAEACRMAVRRLPARSAVLSMQMSGALEYYTDLPYLRYDLLGSRPQRRLRARAEALGYRWVALLHRGEVEAFARHTPGVWRPIEARGDALLLEPDPGAAAPAPAP